MLDVSIGGLLTVADDIIASYDIVLTNLSPPAGGFVFSDGTRQYTAAGDGVAGNPIIGSTVVDSELVLNTNGYNQTFRLGVVSDGYYNSGFTNFSYTIRSK